MSRNRRGVVLSDDEGPAPQRSRLSNGRSDPRSLVSRSSKSRPSAAASASETPVILDNVAKLSPEDLNKIRLLDDENRKLTARITAAIGTINETAVTVELLEDSAANKEMVGRLEESLRSLIDATQHIEHNSLALEKTAKTSDDTEEPIEPHEIFVNTTKALDAEYNEKTPEQKYANVSQFQDFKRMVWEAKHDEPAPENWFSTGVEEEEDDDLVMGQAVQSLKCPITLVLLDKPVRNTFCPHVYSLDAIKELVKQGRGSCECPVPGCDARVTMAGVKEDKVMARKVKEEKAREEEREMLGGREAEAVGDETEIVYGEDDEEMKEE